MADRADPRSSFGPVAENYATSAVHANPAALQRLIELVEPQGGQVIDIATGGGNTALAFAPHVGHVVACDFTPEMTAVVRKRAQQTGFTNLSVAVCRAEALPFRSGAFDGATCRIAPHHFDSPPHFIGEVRRVVRRGGWFLLIDNVGPEDGAACRELDELERVRDPSHRNYLSADLWRGLLHDYGFRIRFEENVAKTIDVQEWLDRMGVTDAARPGIWQGLQAAQGGLADYLQFDGTSFQLREHLFLADNPS